MNTVIILFMLAVATPALAGIVKRQDNDNTLAVVSAEWLHNNTDENVVVLDVSNDDDARRKYKREHIPGAVYFDCFKNAVSNSTHAYPLMPERAFQKHAQKAGINVDTHVIVYDPNPNTAYAGYFMGSRAWYMFRYFGHAKVSVLDGGLNRWKELGFETAEGEEKNEKGNFELNIQSHLLKNYNQVEEAVLEGTQILDARPVHMFDGTPDDPRSGHVKGAINLPFPDTYTENGLLKSESALRTAYETAGVDLDAPYIAMCIGGMSSPTIALTSFILGYRDVPVYVGSFTEWSQIAPEYLIEQTSTDYSPEFSSGSDSGSGYYY